MTDFYQNNVVADGTKHKIGSNISSHIKENLRYYHSGGFEFIKISSDMVENQSKTPVIPEQVTAVSIPSGGKYGCHHVISCAVLFIFRDRIFTVSVLLPDKPGELAKVAQNSCRCTGQCNQAEHNQFVTTNNRSAAVELRITLECFGTEHKEQIIAALEKKGYKPRIVRTMI